MYLQGSWAHAICHNAMAASLARAQTWFMAQVWVPVLITCRAHSLTQSATASHTNMCSTGNQPNTCRHRRHSTQTVAVNTIVATALAVHTHAEGCDGEAAAVQRPACHLEGEDCWGAHTSHPGGGPHSHRRGATCAKPSHGVPLAVMCLAGPNPCFFGCGSHHHAQQEASPATHACIKASMYPTT